MHFCVDFLPCSSNVHRNQKNLIPFLDTIPLLVSSCILAFLLRLVLFAKYRTRKSWADLELELKKAFFFACLLFYCSILLKFHVEYDSEYDQSNKKRYNHLLCKWYCPYPPFIAKTIAEKVKKRKAVLTISLFDALWLYGSRLCKFHLKKYCQIAYINFFFPWLTNQYM